MARFLPASIRGRVALGVVALVVLGGAVATTLAGRGGVEVETAEVRRGDYSDVLEIRGEVVAGKSTLVKAPADAGELQILKLARNGQAVKAGEVVAEFDTVTLKRTIADKQAELRQARAELDQAVAQARINEEQQKTAVMEAEFAVERAKLELGDVELVSMVDAERARLGLADADQKLAEMQAAAAAAKKTSGANLAGIERRIEKIEADLARAEQSATALQVVAPTDGTVSVMENYRSMMPMGAAQEYRAGDRVYPNAQILELPDLSTIYLLARIEEADRGLLRAEQTVTVRADAVADREYAATVADVSVLARVDFRSGWPPPKLFDLRIVFDEADDRLRPGMSAVARIDVGVIEDVLIVPAEAIFMHEGQNVVFRQRGGRLEPVPVDILRRGRDEAAIQADVAPGDRVSLTRPATPGGEGA